MNTVSKICISVIFALTLKVSVAQNIESIDKEMLISENYKEQISAKSIIPIIKMKPVSNTELLNMERKGDHKEKLIKFAHAFNTNVDIIKEGIVEYLDEIGKIYRLSIKSPSAYSLNFTLTDCNIPQNAQLYLYNKDKSIVIKVFSTDSLKSPLISILPIEGDQIFFEYFVPIYAHFNGGFIISRVGHDYKGILRGIEDKDGRFGTSGACNVDINCPEVENWQVEKNSVLRLFIDNEGYCTGTLLNNSNNDGIPYVLTANHCISSESSANNTVFVFNYESPTCDGGDVPYQAISGSVLRAHWATSDFSLLHMYYQPPTRFKPYWSGWNNINTPPSVPATGIHHPSGDVKKISVENNALTSTSYLSNTVNPNENHWRVANWDIGVTEGGSSGSALYNSNHRIIGQLHGGYAACNGSNDNNEPDWYGKLSSSWNGGNTDATRLQNWLDPSNTINEQPGLRLILQETINNDIPVSGDIVRFIDVNVQNGSDIIVEYEESFEAIESLDVPVGSTLLIQPR